MNRKVAAERQQMCFHNLTPPRALSMSSNSDHHHLSRTRAAHIVFACICHAAVDFMRGDCATTRCESEADGKE